MTIGSFVSFPYIVGNKLLRFAGIVVEIHERHIVVRTVGNDFLLPHEDVTLHFDGREFDQPVVILDRDRP